ncbi:hypothetical protein PMZ80_010355 [Knufia obscura]|uniref:Uncharacterized protein n=1 Tax=Knufia obscura TaxID=1635080 RepID=A0ABR0R9P3_9EURO|nr:hypothetical protein PMZ80_010355 [Knufia obscura]
MRFSSSALVLGTLAAGQATAASMYHGKQHNHAARHADILKAHHQGRSLKARDTSLLSAVDGDMIKNLGFSASGLNPTSASGLSPWIGDDGQFTNEFINQGEEDLVLAVWGPQGSWVNAVTPQLTISIPSSGSKTVSFPIGWSGAWAPVHSGSQLVNGQIFDTWGEGTFAPPYSVVDVSREVNMKGKSMAIHTPQCISDMDTCVFKCSDESVEQCLTGYELVNCATGSQAGANFGTYEGAASGGCGGMGDSAALKTYLG